MIRGNLGTAGRVPVELRFKCLDNTVLVRQLATQSVVLCLESVDVVVSCSTVSSCVQLPTNEALAFAGKCKDRRKSSTISSIGVGGVLDQGGRVLSHLEKEGRKVQLY